jgi:hypothetical protein
VWLVSVFSVPFSGCITAPLPDFVFGGGVGVPAALFCGVGLFLENSIASTSIFLFSQSVFGLSFVCFVPVFLEAGVSQAMKSQRWMPWRLEPMKDVGMLR